MFNADGSANVTFEFNLENFGNVNLNNLTLTDDLAATFPATWGPSLCSDGDEPDFGRLYR
ncbi:MAG: hypothetical protein IPH31_18290 [Lewinellaceae bacterium]|nr:hypothetical protein [Lewinellaceae bacterium]